MLSKREEHTTLTRKLSGVIGVTLMTTLLVRFSICLPFRGEAHKEASSKANKETKKEGEEEE